MDYQEPPAIIIQAAPEKHNVAEEVIEHVARLLARADGVDPDHDDRCKEDGNVAVCDLSSVARPAWERYRARSVKLLEDTFKTPPDPCAPLSTKTVYCINPAANGVH